MNRPLLLLLALAWSGIAAGAEAPWLLTHATMIDGTGTPAVADTTIVIGGSRIADVYASGSKPVPEGAKVEDLQGKFVIPGLIDAHVHLTGVAPDAAGYKPCCGRCCAAGSPPCATWPATTACWATWRGETDSGALPSPDIFYAALLSGPDASSRRTDAPRRHRPASRSASRRGCRPSTATTDIPLAIAEAKGTGATGVKLYANLPAALVEALAAEAHRQGLRVWTHATIFPARPSDAVAAGADTISHSPYLVWEAAPRVPATIAMRAQGDFAHIKPDAPAHRGAVRGHARARHDPRRHARTFSSARTPSTRGQWAGASCPGATP